MDALYACDVRLQIRKDGWTSTRQMPLFYLHPNVQGILNEEHAAEIAISMFKGTLDLAGDSDIQVFATVVKV